MSQISPKLALWILSHFGFSAKKDEVAGDIYERFGRGQSCLRLWREVVWAVAFGAWETFRSNRSFNMKRVVVVMFILAAGFVLGFWAARNPLMVHEEMPPIAELMKRQDDRHTRSIQAATLSRTRTARMERDNGILRVVAAQGGIAWQDPSAQWLRNELRHVESLYQRLPSWELKEVRDELKAKLEQEIRFQNGRNNPRVSNTSLSTGTRPPRSPSPR